jgi:hypothetical protein
MKKLFFDVTSDSDWLNAYYDPVACINSHSNALELADLFADGDNKFIAAHYSLNKTELKLKVFKGASLIKESNLVDTPTALISLYMDNLQPRVPGIDNDIYMNIYVNKLAYDFCNFYLKQRSRLRLVQVFTFIKT